MHLERHTILRPGVTQFSRQTVCPVAESKSNATMQQLIAYL